MILLAMNPGHVGAVGLGDLQLKSRLGQPLEAVVPVTLGKGESLPENCVKPAPSNPSLGAPPNINVSAPSLSGPGVYDVRINTAKPLHEPMYELSLMVKCQGVPLLVRQYVLMLDLPGMAVRSATPEPVVSAISPPPAPRRASNNTRNDAPVTRRAPADPARALPPRSDNIAAGSLYRVSSADTLSTIARRVTGRLPDTTWAVANQIFADNPDAFIRNDPNLIKLGSLVRVPEANVLAALAPGSQRGLTAAASTPQPEAPVESPREQTTDTRAPVAVSRNQPVAASQTTEVPTERAAARSPVSVPTEADAALAPMEAAPADVATPDPVGTDASDDSSSFNPFADGQSVDTAVDAPDIAEEITPTPVETTDAAPIDAEAESGESGSLLSISSLLSVLLAVLVGAGLSLFVLRDRLMETLGSVRRKNSFAARARRPRAAAGRTGAFDESFAAAAFETSSDATGDRPVLPISGPVEDTYIVETALAEPTVEEDHEGLRVNAQESDTTGQPPTVDAGSTINEDEDSAELASLFEEPTAQMPQATADSLEPTAQIPRQADGEFFDPTTNVAQIDDDETFDPTAELPQGALDDIFDPTGGLDIGKSGEIEPTLVQAFNEDLENLDPDEMFATAGHLAAELVDESGVNTLDAKFTDTLDDPMLNDPTVATELDDLPHGQDEDDGLSETLQEALDLLERDYEDEFTASQILERSALEKSLKEDLG